MSIISSRRTCSNRSK